MSIDELKAVQAPFKVRPKGKKGKKHIATVVGFTRQDPLGVGGGMFPDMPCVYFEKGGWLLVSDLLAGYEIVA